MNIYDTAKKLAKEIRESKEYKEYKKLKTQIEENPETKEQVENFEKMRYSVQVRTLKGEETLEEKQNLQKDYERLLQNEQIKTTLQRLDEAIQKVQKRSNSLKDIIIPNYIKQQKTIQETLDERDREEFTRLKVIKK